jgi:hypothetical protein
MLAVVVFEDACACTRVLLAEVVGSSKFLMQKSCVVEGRCEKEIGRVGKEEESFWILP